ncbi:MAG: hypothetical protein ACRD0Z_14295 [Acidimicrobiales bacterium]
MRQLTRRGWFRVACTAVAVVVAVASFAITLRDQDAQASVTMTPGDFESITLSYSASMLAIEGNQPLTATFGLRSSSPSSRSGATLSATINATGLVRVATPSGDVVGLDLVPAPEGFATSGGTVGFPSTAEALIADTPAVAVSSPLTMMILAKVIDGMSTTQTLANELQADAVANGPTYLAHPDQAVTTALGSALAALSPALASGAKRIESNPAAVFDNNNSSSSTTSSDSTGGTTATPKAPSATPALTSAAATSPLPVSCDGPGIAPVGGLEGDDVCISVVGDSSVHGQETVSLVGVNRAPRWVFVYAHGAGSSPSPLAVLAPKTWSVPSLSALLSALYEAFINSSLPNVGKKALHWLTSLFGVTYHPYYSATPFPQELVLQIRQFADDTTTSFDVTPNQAREIETWTPGNWDLHDPGAPTDWDRVIVPAVLTLALELLEPLLYIFLDIKSAVKSAKKSAEENKKKKNESSTTKAKGGSTTTGESTTTTTPTTTTKATTVAGATTTTSEPGSKESASSDDVIRDTLGGPACLNSYVHLSVGLTDSISTLWDDFSSKSVDFKTIAEGFGAVITGVLGDSDAVGCLFGVALDQAAKSGALGEAAQDTLSALFAAGIDGFPGAVSLVLQGGNVSATLLSVAKQALDSIASALFGMVVKEVIEKIALLIDPAGDLLTVVNIVESAPELASLGLTVVDLVNTLVTSGDGSVYTLDSASAIRHELQYYPTTVGTPANPGYVPDWWDEDPTVSSTIGGKSEPGYWVSGDNQLDSFYASGKAAYSLRATANSGNTSLTLTKNDGSGHQDWSVSLPDPSSDSSFGILLASRTGNIFVYGTSSLTSIAIVNGHTGAVVVNIEKVAGPAELFSGGAWMLEDLSADSLAVNNNLNTYLFDTTTGTEHTYSGLNIDYALDAEQGADALTADASTGTFYKITGTSLQSLGTMPHPPAVNDHGVTWPECNGDISYVTTDGYVATDTLNGHQLWLTRADPAQGSGAGNRATFSSVLPNCDVIATDDHGYVSDIQATTGSTPHFLWTSRYGYYSEKDNYLNTDAAYPLTGLVVAGNEAIVASSYDPHVVAFKITAGGALLWSYPLTSQVLALQQLGPTTLLAIGTDGTLTDLQLPAK